MKTWKSSRGMFFGVLLLLGALFLLTGCMLPLEDSSLQETTMALAVQATINAVEKESQVEEMEEVPQQAQQDESQQQTAVAQSVQSTLNASLPTETDLPVATQTPEVPTATMEPVDDPTPTLEPQTTVVGFEEWMKSADILLYEDMAGVFTTTRFIKEALDRMGLNYVDVGDAVGHYKERLLSGGPDGDGWDLIISGKEARGHVQGEFYIYLNDALNEGSSVIVEEWAMDSTVRGSLGALLDRCGVKYQADWTSDPLNKQLLWQVDGKHPIHHQPNEGIALTNPTGYWAGSDLGDFMRQIPGSDAEPLWVARVNVDQSYITSVSCLDNQMIIQTFATHSYGKNRVIRNWENYIYNTLLARYQSLQE